MKYWFFEILKFFAIPLIIIIVVIFLLPRFINIKNQEVSRVVLGIMLGVVLGFSADLAKRGLDDFLAKQRLRKVSLKVLEEDAKDIYRAFWLWERFQESNKIPADVKRHIPAELDLRYWDILRQDKDFLMLGAEEPFDKIFKEMANFEKINNQIRLAKQGDKQAYSFAIVFYKLVVAEQSHKELLRIFKTEKEIEELDQQHIKGSGQFINK